MLESTVMSKQKAINFYIEECAKMKQDLETEKIKNERIRRQLRSYTCFEAYQGKKSENSDTGKKQSVDYKRCLPPIWEAYSPRRPVSDEDDLPNNIDVTFTSSDTDHESELIKKVVDEVLDTDEESKSESETSSSTSNSSKTSVKKVYNKEFLLSKNNLNDETFKVAYTLNDSDKLYSDEQFPIRSVKFEMINKVFKLTEIDISEIKDANLNDKPKKYTSRVQ
ncbi:hypothetical protein Hanom_Chr07g00588281 [Helianthus anomalus]